MTTRTLDNPHEVNPHEVNPHEVNPHEVNPHEVNPHEVNPHEVNPHEVNWHNVNTPKQNPRPNDVAKQLTGRNYLSYSAVATFQQCPLKYQYRYLERLPEETKSSSLVFGTAAHASVEHHFRELMRGQAPPSHANLVDLFWASWSEESTDVELTFGRHEDIKSIARLATSLLAAFQQSDFARPAGSILGVEEQLRGSVVDDVPDLLARIDLLIETDHTLTVSDFKTTRSRWSDDQAELQSMQLLAYSGLARQLAPTKELKLEFVVATKTRQPVIANYPVPWNRHRVDRAQSVLQQVWRAIQTGVFYPAPSPLTCPSCPFRAQCAAWNTA